MDIDELMNRDPLTYTKEGGEIAAIIKVIRERRQQHLAGAKSAGDMRPKLAKEVKPLDLKSIGL